MTDRKRPEEIVKTIISKAEFLPMYISDEYRTSKLQLLMAEMVKAISAERAMPSEDEIEKLATEWYGNTPDDEHCWHRGSFKAGFKKAQSMNAIEWPTTEEIEKEVAKLYFKDTESSRAQAFRLGVEWLKNWSKK